MGELQNVCEKCILSDHEKVCAARGDKLDVIGSELALTHYICLLIPWNSVLYKDIFELATKQ